MFIYIYYKCCRKGAVHPAERMEKLEKDDESIKNQDASQSSMRKLDDPNKSFGTTVKMSDSAVNLD
jgi:hypothetical protein